MQDSGSRDQIRRNLIQTVIGRPLIDKLEASHDPNTVYHVIIDPNLDFGGGREKARERIEELIQASLALPDPDPRVRYDAAHPYVFATLSARAIREITEKDSAGAAAALSLAQTPGKQRLTGGGRAIYRIWEDMEVRAFLTNSVATVKADAARLAFSAEGKDIVWAVIDSGIDQTHDHFKLFSNLNLSLPLEHKDFTNFTDAGGSPLTDGFGHGTHVAGIIAGMMDESTAPQAIVRTRDGVATDSAANDGAGEFVSVLRPLGRSIRGMAPRCTLISLKVLGNDGCGKASAVIQALAEVQKMNDFGRRIVIHGVNMSLGYPFMPEWFGCGQSPICVEVNRLVKSGVVVVVAAGNSGYGDSVGIPQSIADPGNAEYAITVGSTHRDMPHMYGVSYFSSKGPTGDGRLKPDLVAPGERILSCAAGIIKTEASEVLPDADKKKPFQYVEDSGTSMAAPHVSGVIAAFLSIRREFIGRPEDVKKLFLNNATDLHRDRTFQGHGLVDLMRVIQAV